MRGGSWINDPIVRSAYRAKDVPSFSFSDLGFRCSRSP
ncbi:MAG: hypothetical protein IPN96_00020 [Anaerolineales bacterium]|nr:hypothetical protein [Anaerolineales bacterium]